MAEDNGRWWCRYYSGYGNGPVCKIGVLYESIKEIHEERPIHRFPCFEVNVNTCEKREYYTDEEWAQHEKALADRLDQFRAFMSREQEYCFHCGRPVTSLQQVGRCVYANPCGCRMWRGKIPDVWKQIR